MGDAVARGRRRGVHRRVDHGAAHLRKRAARPGRPHVGDGTPHRRARVPRRRRDAARARRRDGARAASRTARRRHADDERLHGLDRLRRSRAAARPAGDDVLGLARPARRRSIRRSRCGPTTGSWTAERSSRPRASRPASTWRSTSCRGFTPSSGRATYAVTSSTTPSRRSDACSRAGFRQAESRRSDPRPAGGADP